MATQKRKRALEHGPIVDKEIMKVIKAVKELLPVMTRDQLATIEFIVSTEALDRDIEQSGMFDDEESLDE